LLRLIGARITTVSVDVVNRVRRLVLALGVERINADLPSDFAVYEAQEGGVSLFTGAGLSGEVAAALRLTVSR
jgi:hypothetical protein